MDYIQITEELETDLTWRMKELKFLKNNLSNFNNDDDKNIYRKALIVMLYSHFEGFCRFTFKFFITTINSQKHKRKELNYFLRASSMDTIFSAYETRDKKCKEFKRTLPDDTKLHRLSRQKDFVCEFNDFLNVIAKIPDEIADTESNLKPTILRKILFKLGFNIQIIDNYESTISELLNYRNSIAHGSQKDGIKKESYEIIEKKIINIMDDIKLLIARSLKDKTYLYS